MFQNNKSQKALDALSQILNLPSESKETIPRIFEEISTIFENDKAYILFLTPTGMSLKYSYGISQTQSQAFKKTIDLTPRLEQMMNDKKSFIITTGETNLLSLIFNFKASNEKTFLISPLKIRNSVFGILAIEKNGLNSFCSDDLKIADSFAAVISYVIKDSELSDVFKMQLKILQENIAEKVRAYKIIEEQNKKILESGKIKDEFLANISHELRTPLSAIIGFSDALREQIFGPLNPKQNEYVREINSGAVHLLGLLNGILDMSKIESNQMPLSCMNFEVQRAIDEVINVVKTLAEKKNISISKRYPKEPVKIYADFKKFQQIIYNLLSNAIKYNNKDGKIEISFEAENKKLKVCVKDSGIGIDKKYHGKIFAKFQQVENIYTKSESSTGLGLTITKEFVEMHNGKIWLESKLNEGSSFIFEIPMI